MDLRGKLHDWAPPFNHFFINAQIHAYTPGVEQPPFELLYILTHLFTEKEKLNILNHQALDGI